MLSGRFMYLFSPPTTAMICPPGQAQQNYNWICQGTCVKRHPKCMKRIDGCVCQNGYLLSGTHCVKENQCGCIYKRFYMEVSRCQFDLLRSILHLNVISMCSIFL